jgi:hypothetical protein
VIAEFQTALADAIAHPHSGSNPGQMWIDIDNIYWWCRDVTNNSLAIQIKETQRQIAALPGGLVSFEDMDNIELAYAYMGEKRWQDAIDIFEGFHNRPVDARAEGPWGEAFKPIFTDKLAAYCKGKLGQPGQTDPRLFDLGKPLLRLCPLSTFAADGAGLWIATGGQLQQLDFDLRTNFAIKLPVDDSVPITALCLTPSSVWISTRGAGLIEFDKTSRQCRHLTEADGLLMNDIASLESTDDTLWIGYGGVAGGGLGNFDMRSRKLTSFMPALDAVAGSNAPPRGPITEIVAGTDGEIWMITGKFAPGSDVLSAGSVVHRFNIAQGIWEAPLNQPGGWICSIAADSTHLVEGNGAVLLIQNRQDRQWQNLSDPGVFLNRITALTLAGNDLWAGCEGTIALVALKENKVKKFCHTNAREVGRIQIAGGCIWAQVDWYLYRVPFSALQ